LDVIENVRPSRLYFAVDGPRPDRAGEADAVRQVRELASKVHWDCEVRTLFRDRNLGCKLAVSEAISWFFSEVESGIILEDDCVAHPSFFPFAAELLEHYRDDERVMMVSGDNFQQGRKRGDHSYYFSRYTHIWGWATWRRAWSLYDHRMRAWPGLRAGSWLRDMLKSDRAADYWTRVFDETHAERNTSWAYRWMFSAWSQNGLTVLPNVNLVSNIGFGDQATHTTGQHSPIAELETTAIQFPLRHPPYVILDAMADRFTEEHLFSRLNVWRRAVGRLGRTLRPIRARTN
jgi:hypothetical protein